MQLLLVEDDLQLGAALQAALQQAGKPTTWVRTREDGWLHLDADTHAALLLDINLPDGDGFVLLERLRAARLQVPVLVITARDALDDRLRGLQGGADDYIVKPFAVAELVARIDAVLRRAAGHAGPVWEAGALRIDPGGRSVQCEGRALALSKREFDLLLELCRCAGRVVQRESLIQRVWGPGRDVSENALEFQIHALRKKIAPATIHTVRGVGYTLTTA